MIAAPSPMQHDDATGALELIVDDPDWDRQGQDWAQLARALHAVTLEKLAETGPAPGAIAVLLSGDAHLAELNAQFRGEDGPTNVLSFPAPPATGMLGDIALAYGVCAREAADQNKTFADHAAHLILHGILHLHGLDHETGEDEARAMEALERDILAGFGIADPYAGEEARLNHVS